MPEAHDEQDVASPISARWLHYFRQHRSEVGPFPWKRGVTLTPHERHAITASLQEFQLGESGEGKHLMRCAKRWAAAAGDAHYVEALGLFIAEENRHSRDLGRYLDLADISRIGHAWPDAVFRFLRHHAGLELSIAVLVTAEVFAQAYYAALRDATACPLLHSLCQQILMDEEMHVRFQTQRLAILRRGRSRRRVGLAMTAHRLLFAGTALVVWHKHRHVFRGAKWDLSGYLREMRRLSRRALPWTDPRALGKPVGPLPSATQAPAAAAAV